MDSKKRKRVEVDGSLSVDVHLLCLKNDKTGERLIKYFDNFPL